MANRRLSMRKIKEVLRLKGEKNLSARQVAISCDIARSTVSSLTPQGLWLISHLLSISFASSLYRQFKGLSLLIKRA